jgi:hypothetical protein
MPSDEQKERLEKLARPFSVKSLRGGKGDTPEKESKNLIVRPRCRSEP